MWAGCCVFFNFALGSSDVLWVTSLLLALFYRSESEGATVFTYLIWKMWGLINVCKDLVDHPPEMLHLCYVIFVHCKKFSLNLFSPSNDLLKMRKYYCKWLGALFNMDYISFRASDMRTYATWGPSEFALWCFLNEYHRLSSPAWIAGWHLEMRIQISGSTNLWIWAHSVRGGLRKPWMRKDTFSTPDASRLSLFSQSVVENRKFSLMGRNMSNWHYWYLVERLELFMMVKSLFILYSQNEGKEGNMKNSAPY